MKYRVLIEQDEDGFFVAEARNHPTRHVREAGLWCVSGARTVIVR
jgi:hypothetical protein